MVPAAACRREIRAPPVVERCRGTEPQERCIRVRTRVPSIRLLSFEEKGNPQRGMPTASKPAVTEAAKQTRRVPLETAEDRTGWA